MMEENSHFETCICGAKFSISLDSRRLYCNNRKCKNLFLSETNKEFREMKVRSHVKLKVEKIKTNIKKFVIENFVFQPFQKLINKFTLKILDNEDFVFKRHMGVITSVIIYIMGIELGLTVKLMELSELFNTGVSSITMARKRDKLFLEETLKETIEEYKTIAGFVHQKSLSGNALG